MLAPECWRLDPTRMLRKRHKLVSFSFVRTIFLQPVLICLTVSSPRPGNQPVTCKYKCGHHLTRLSPICYGLRHPPGIVLSFGNVPAWPSPYAQCARSPWTFALRHRRRRFSTKCFYSPGVYTSSRPRVHCSGLFGSCNRAQQRRDDGKLL